MNVLWWLAWIPLTGWVLTMWATRSKRPAAEEKESSPVLRGGATTPHGTPPPPLPGPAPVPPQNSDTGAAPATRKPRHQCGGIRLTVTARHPDGTLDYRIHIYRGGCIHTFDGDGVLVDVRPCSQPSADWDAVVTRILDEA